MTVSSKFDATHTHTYPKTVAIWLLKQVIYPGSLET